MDPLASSASRGTFRITLKAADLSLYVTRSGRFWFNSRLLEEEVAFEQFRSGEDPAKVMLKFNKLNMRLDEQTKFETLLKLLSDEHVFRFRTPKLIARPL